MKCLLRRQRYNKSLISTLSAKEKDIIFMLCTRLRDLIGRPVIVPRARWPETDGFWRRSGRIPNRECIPRRFPRNLLFVRGVGREELREDPSERTARRWGGRQLLALHVCRRIRRVIDGRAETKMRALCLATWSDLMFIFVYELFSLASVAISLSLSLFPSFFFSA